MAPSRTPPGTLIAERYRVMSLLGRGGMAEVYRARHIELQRDVAVKIMKSQPGRDFGTRFEREARAVARLDHPGCIRVLDFGRDAVAGRFLVMELIEGPTLRDYLSEHGALPAHSAVTIARELLKALAHAHRHGVLHRDIKPENIMFDMRDGASRPRLIDFGLAHLHGEAAVTAVGSCVGSPSYLAPERLLDRPYDARADIYALGVILYELLSGHRPFGGDSAIEIARKQIDMQPVPLSVLGIEVPPALADVVDRALAKDPARRYIDCEQMLAALEAIEWRPTPSDVTSPRRQQPALSAEITAPIIDLVEARPNWARRLWTWLRFGPWRLRAIPTD